MAAKGKFIKQFFKDRQMVGAVAPSTRFLTEKMLENIDFETAKVIVELGPGNGIFTGILLDRMSPDAKLYVFELNDVFYKELSEKYDDPRLELIHDSAEYISKYVGESGHVDAVISSLPLMVFPEQLRSAVVRAAHESLASEGKYIQFQYSLQSKKFLENIFKSVSVRFTVRNFPPAFVYTCLKDSNR
jgi:phospholipid N-methyltransferase